MNRGFRPPPLADFHAPPDAVLARAQAETRELGYAEGHAQGLAEGHAAGFAEGAADARSTLGPELETLRENSAKRDRRVGVADALRQVLAARDADLVAVEREMREAAATALRTLFPSLLAHAAGSEIAALLGDALTERASEALVLRAHQDTLDTIAAETAAERETGRLVLDAVPAMAFGVAEVAWTGGGITFDPAALLARVTTLLGALPATGAAAVLSVPGGSVAVATDAAGSDFPDPPVSPGSVAPDLIVPDLSAPDLTVKAFS